MCCSSKSSGGGFKALLLGLLSGIVIGILYAPRPGSETVASFTGRMGGQEQA